MLDLRRSAAPHAVRLALVALLLLMGLWAAAPAARAASGELSAFGTTVYPPAADGEFFGAGPVALDPSDNNSLFVADVDGNGLAHLRKFSKDGDLLASVLPSLSDPSGKPPYIVGLAIDPGQDLLYALVVADVHGLGTALQVRVYSTTTAASCGDPTPCALTAPATPAALADGVLFDFRDVGNTSSGVEFASGLAVDPGTHDVVVLGVDDATAGDPAGVLQYLAPAGTAGTRVTGLGAGLEPNGTTVSNPSGLGIAPNGDVYVETGVPSGTPYVAPFASASVYRLARGTGTSQLVLQDASVPYAVPGAFDIGGGLRLGVGSPIAVSRDGDTVYLAEGDGATARARGFSTATGALRIVYGGGTTSCFLVPTAGIGLSAGDGDDLALALADFAGNVPGNPPTVHLFGEGGSGCPRAQGLFTVNGSGSGTVTVTKGQAVTLDASMSQLLSGTPTKVAWDFDGSQAFATELTGSPAPLTTTYKFLTPGTVQVGVRIEADGAPPTDPVFHQVKVVAPVPTASFKASNRNPAPGASVTFDASDSVDSAGSATGGPTNALAKYRWDFGDGQSQETTTAKVDHAFANGGTAALARTVKLTVVSKDGVTSSAVQQAITVAGTPASNPTTTTKAPTPTTTTPAPPPAVTPPSPVVTAKGVDAKGTLTMKVACPAGGPVCTGKVELTVKVKKKVNGKAKTTTVKLGTATFTVDPGKSKDVKLKLSATGRSLLKKQKKLSATAAISATAGGGTSKTTKTLSLKASAAKK